MENNSWMVAYAPTDDPKIVVVCYIQNGYSGSMSSPAVIKVIEHYLDNLASEENTQVGLDFSIAD